VSEFIVEAVGIVRAYVEEHEHWPDGENSLLDCARDFLKRYNAAGSAGEPEKCTPAGPI
jgi:hypothetical protein